VLDDIYEKPWFQLYFPPAAGLVFVVVFISLGLWQLERAAEKEALLRMFGTSAPFSRLTDHASLEQFDRIETFGRYLGDRQVLIDNIVRNGRPGYYVITPFRSATNEALLLVNRGWVQKEGASREAPDVAVDDSSTTVRGFVGHLPRVGIRPGEAFEGSDEWPRVAVYPRLDEIATELGAELLPFVLLLHPAAEQGFLRQWQPDSSAPMTHYSYALQWFAMAAAVAGILIWFLRKRFSRGRSAD
jgi:surfeit locus 1 family protein